MKYILLIVWYGVMMYFSSYQLLDHIIAVNSIAIVMLLLRIDDKLQNRRNSNL